FDAVTVDFFGVFVAAGSADGAVFVAPFADDVEALEGEAVAVHFFVATGAGGVAAMFVQLLADGGAAADVGLDGAGIGRRGRGDDAEELVHDEGAALDGRSGGAVGG